ncbi:MAG: hypothetical protein KatS3mg108_2281 [Isosphaeraceae bacterium]|jgi:hypothetical protein|nr:MAG: hypothetical protein KatS3mg108_2281 [Isosphaeraceae bacterium]
MNRTIRLGDLAHARSGDKGDTLTIGVVADTAARYDWLVDHLDEARVAAFLEPLGCTGRIRRYLLPRVRAINLVVEGGLAGGASRSLRLDTQGKAIGTAILELRLPSPPEALLASEGPDDGDKPTADA